MEKPGIYFIPWVTFSHFEQPQKESVLSSDGQTYFSSQKNSEIYRLNYQLVLHPQSCY